MRLKQEMDLQVGGSGLFDGGFFDNTNRCGTWARTQMLR